MNNVNSLPIIRFDWAGPIHQMLVPDVLLIFSIGLCFILVHFVGKFLNGMTY